MNAKSVEVVSIEVDNDSSLVDVLDSAEGSGSSESSESTEAPETTEAPEATDAPESTDPPQILSGRSAPAVDLDIEEVHKFIHHVMSTVGDMFDSVVRIYF